MTDLQCPATAVLLDDGASPPLWLPHLPVADRFQVQGPDAVVELIDATADLYRGETFVVAAPYTDIVEALRLRGLAGNVPGIVEVDSAGWHAVSIRAPQAGP